MRETSSKSVKDKSKQVMGLFLKRTLIFLLVAISALEADASQNDSLGRDRFEFTGFIKTDMFSDSRQTVGVRGGLLALYPMNAEFDDNGKDINARRSLNLLSIHSRVRMVTPARKILGAAILGYLEADFLGNENTNFADLNGLRIRHAYVNLVWPRTKLLIGQYWHPMFFAQAFPQVVSVNTGIPFQPLSRNPQIRLTYSFGRYDLVGAIFSQLDFPSTGPEGVSPSYLRNSGLPNVNFQVHRRQDSSASFFAVALDYKVLLPERVSTASGQKLHSGSLINSTSLMGVANIENRRFTIRAASVYAQNPYDMLMLGGYAVSSSTEGEKRSFANLQTLSFWADMQSKGTPLQFGGFAGFTRNLGSRSSVTDEFYARGANIGYVYRFAPRVQLKFDQIWFSFEYEYTSAAYGQPNADQYGRVAQLREAANSRLLLSVRYNF